MIVQLSIHDRPRYDKYADALLPTLQQYDGLLLSADDSPRTLEGEWSGDRVVLLQFPDRDAFRTWASSQEYQAIVGDRHAAAESTILLVRGVD